MGGDEVPEADLCFVGLRLAHPCVGSLSQGHGRGSGGLRAAGLKPPGGPSLDDPGDPARHASSSWHPRQPRKASWNLIGLPPQEGEEVRRLRRSSVGAPSLFPLWKRESFSANSEKPD